MTHDTILRCRINAAFRSQVERRINAAEGLPEESCPAPFDPLRPSTPSFLKLFAFIVVYCYRPKARELNLIDYASSVFSLFVIQSLTGGLNCTLVVR